ncbi:MAG: hypothetical protein M1322_01965 [Candidatus Parvarchaeota archaeon]|jgi:hypothetical protein|nr:hypothetical protein [Candidatus Parvarchaeota archaeon]MCL5106862.1 hypothetical protein [Candidatus Parvarchaeota archaeon]
MGLLKIIFYVIIAIVVFSLISTYIININAPEVAGLISQSVTSFFKSANSNNTLVSNGANFSYPGDWLIFSPSVVNGVPILSQNNSISKGISNELTNSSVSIIIPNSYVSNLIGDIPSVISGALSKNLSLASISKLIKNVNLVLVSDFNAPANFSNATNINEVSGFLNAFKINTLNYSKINLSGEPGVMITDKNIKIPQIDNLSFAYVKVAIAITGKTVCMVFGLSAQNSSINTVNIAFKRVTESIKCREK